MLNKIKNTLSMTASQLWNVLPNKACLALTLMYFKYFHLPRSYYYFLSDF